MPAPTALLRAPDQLADETAKPETPQEPEPAVLLDPNAIPDSSENTTNKSQPDAPEAMQIDPENRPLFAPSTQTPTIHRIESRKVPIPPHRMTPLRNSWTKIYPPLVEYLKLQVRMNTKAKAVELRTSKVTTNPGALQQGEDFIKAFSCGFEVEDAIALLRLDDLYIETFEIKDVKTLNGEHLGRAIGRIAGQNGKTKFAIENASRTRVVLADQKVHILGGFKNIHIAREAIVSLILGSPPGKVYGNLRTVASRMKERF
ncbi:MAG: pre-rRNA-processing protein pno1 [Bogoriella megaspora]|nr:MAG: pre-rRNA-processing protein pno1 [Bogoriella megaspora]